MWETIIAVAAIMAVIWFFENQTKQVKTEIVKARDSILAELRNSTVLASPESAEWTSEESQLGVRPEI
jgi:hypothetical protein